jgi:hypothetical protein
VTFLIALLYLNDKVRGTNFEKDLGKVMVDSQEIVLARRDRGNLRDNLDIYEKGNMIKGLR